MSGYLTTHEIATRLKVHHDTVRDWIRRGQLRAVRAGNQYRVTEEDLQTFLKRETGGEEGSIKKADALVCS